MNLTLACWSCTASASCPAPGPAFLSQDGRRLVKVTRVMRGSASRPPREFLRARDRHPLGALPVELVVSFVGTLCERVRRPRLVATARGPVAPRERAAAGRRPIMGSGHVAGIGDDLSAFGPLLLVGLMAGVGTLTRPGACGLDQLAAQLVGRRLDQSAHCSHPPFAGSTYS